MNIVSTNIPYNSNLLKEHLSRLIQFYPFIRIQTIGNSVLGNPLYVIRLGYGSNKVFYSGSFHANEWITTTILMKFIEDYSVSFVNRSNLYGYSICNLFKSSSIYILPMVNPDGVDLVTGYLAVSSPYYQKALNIANEFSSIPFPEGWKANINGIDLNLQFPSRMEKCKKNKIFSRI